MIAPGVSVFSLSAGQISRRIKVATNVAGLGEGFGAHFPRARVGMAQDQSAAGAELPELMIAGTTPPCRPSAPRPRRPVVGPWPDSTGGNSSDQR